MTQKASPPPAYYIRRSLELRAAEYYARIRKPESEWRAIEDLQPQLIEIEHRFLAGDYDGAARVLQKIATHYLFKWGYYAQLGRLREGLLGHIKDQRLQAENLGGLGSVYYALGNFDSAIQFHQEALVLARQIGYQRGVSGQLGRLGIIYRSLFQIEQAQQCYEESLQIARSINDPAMEVYRLGNLGTILLLLGQHQRALELYQQSVTIARGMGKRWEEGIRLGGVGRVYHALGLEEQARQYFQQGLLIAEEIGDRQRKSEYLRELAHSHASSGQRDTAMTLCQDGLNTAREIGHRWGEAHCLLVLGRISLMNGNFTEAEQYCAEAYSLNVLVVNYQATLLLGITQLSRHDPRAAMTFSEAITHCQTLLDRTANLYAVRHTLAAALLGLAVCNPHWIDHTRRADLLIPALTEYRRAFDITTAPGAVRDALHDLDLIRAAGVEGLEPVFRLLEGVLNEHS